MVSNSSQAQLRTVTYISAGAALLAVIGYYFLLKTDRKKPRRKSTNDGDEKETINKLNKLDNEFIRNKKQELISNEISENKNEGVNAQRKCNLDERDRNVYNYDHQVVPENLVSNSIVTTPTKEIESFLNKFNENENKDPLNIDLKNIESKNLDGSDSGLENNEMQSFYDQNKNFEFSLNQDNFNRAVSNSPPPNYLNSTKKEETLVKVEVNNTQDKPGSSEHIKTFSESNKETESYHDVLSLNQETNGLNESLSKIDLIETSNEIQNKLSPSILLKDNNSEEIQKISINKEMNNIKVLNGSNGNNNNRIHNSASNSSVSSSLSTTAKNSPSKNKESKRSKSKSINKITSKTSELKNKDKDFFENNDIEDLVVYEFNFPRKLCGKLIGKNGVHVDFIRSKTETQIAVRNDPELEDLQIVCVSGRISDVDKALDLIGHRFPSQIYPQISFKPISKPIVYRRFNNKEKSDSPLENDASKILVASTNFVEFIDKKNADNTNQLVSVQITAIVNAGHIFVQLPNNPTYNELQQLDKNMLNAYDNITEIVPNMNEPIEYGTICAAPTSYGWHRAMITNYQSYDSVKNQIPDYNEMCGLATVKFLDYGGYLNIPVSQLRQLRSDFMLLPFQGIECYLDECWCANENLIEEGKMFLSHQIKNSTTEATMIGYNEEDIPLIRLYISNDSVQKYCINEELGRYGLVVNYKNKEEINNGTNYNPSVQNIIFNNASINTSINTKNEDL